MPMAVDNAIANAMKNEDKKRAVLMEDLEMAGISRMEADGGKIDFHALRHTFCMLLQANGVHSGVSKC